MDPNASKGETDDPEHSIASHPPTLWQVPASPRGEASMSRRSEFGFPRMSWSSRSVARLLVGLELPYACWRALATCCCLITCRVRATEGAILREDLGDPQRDESCRKSVRTRLDQG